MLKSYEAIYENGKLNWLGIAPALTNAKVIVVVFEEDVIKNNNSYSIQQLKGIVPKPEQVVSLEEMNAAIQLEGAKL